MMVLIPSTVMRPDSTPTSPPFSNPMAELACSSLWIRIGKMREVTTRVSGSTNGASMGHASTHWIRAVILIIRRKKKLWISFSEL